MAAIIAITLYMELPRLAMQTQRDKEQTLIDRGEQYKRAIQLFVAKAKRYPGDIKELESFQNQRFLRHRYEDPMTGKEEWRLIHIQNGILTDSKLTKPAGPGGDKQPTGPNGFVGEQAGLGGTQNPNPGGGAASQRDRRRPSESDNATMPGPGCPRRRPVWWAEPGDTTISRPGAGQNGPMDTSTAAKVIHPGLHTRTSPRPTGIPGQQGLPGQGTIPGQSGMPTIPGRGVPTNTANNTKHYLGQQLRWRRRFIRGRRRILCRRWIGHRVPALQSGPDRLPRQPGMYPGQTLPGQPGAPVNSQGGGVSPYPIQAGSNGTPCRLSRSPALRRASPTPQPT